MITIYTVQQGELDYDDNYYYLKSSEYGKVVGQFLKEEEAKELKEKLINFSYNLLKDKIDWVDLSDHFVDYKRPSEAEDYEKLHALKEDLAAHITIKAYELDDSHIVHPDNKSPLKMYCSWNTMDADTFNEQRKQEAEEERKGGREQTSLYLNMSYDNPDYESVLEEVMDIAESNFDADYGFSWYNIEWAWDVFLERYYEA